MITRTQITALPDAQLVDALQSAAAIIATAATDKFKGMPAARVARQRNAQEAKAAIEHIRAEIKLREYKAAHCPDGLLVERRPGWCWGDETPAYNRTSKKGGGVWMPVR